VVDLKPLFGADAAADGTDVAIALGVEERLPTVVVGVEAC
jgi:hypothetical protein